MWGKRSDETIENVLPEREQRDYVTITENTNIGTVLVRLQRVLSGINKMRTVCGPAL